MSWTHAQKYFHLTEVTVPSMFQRVSTTLHWLRRKIVMLVLQFKTRWWSIIHLIHVWGVKTRMGREVLVYGGNWKRTFQPKKYGFYNASKQRSWDQVSVICICLHSNEVQDGNRVKRRHNSTIFKYHWIWSTAAHEERQWKKEKPKKEENIGVMRNGCRTVTCSKTFPYVLIRCSRRSRFQGMLCDD